MFPRLFAPLTATLGIAQPFRKAGLWRFGTFEPDQLEPHTAHEPETKSEEVTGKLQHLSQALGAMDKGLSPGVMTTPAHHETNVKCRPSGI